MNSDVVSEITGLAVEELASIASQVLGEDAVPSGLLEVQKIGRSVGRATAGIFRVSGEAQTGTGARQWSAVVKALGRPEHHKAGVEATALHEAEIYRSGVFAKTCGGVRAPHCYAILNRGSFVLLWLEDLSHAPQPPWTPDLFIATARNLGRFNAHWPEDDLPSWPWLATGGICSMFHSARFRESLMRLPTRHEHPLVGRSFPLDDIRDLQRLLDESEAMLAQVEAAPKGICHRDCHWKNLFPMCDPDGHSYTIGIDWPHTGVDALGLDVGHLLGSPMTWLELRAEEIQSLIDPVFNAYVRGLDEEGWRGNVDQVRITFLTRLSFEVVRHTNTIDGAMLDPDWQQLLEKLLGCPTEEIADRYAATRGLLLDCKAEAQRLAQRLGTIQLG